VYDCLFLGLADLFAMLPFSKNFDFFKTFLEGLVRIEGRSLTISACLYFENSAFLTGLLILLLEVNLDNIFCLNILLSSVLSEFHPALSIERINCQAAYLSCIILFTRLCFALLFLMKFTIYKSKVIVIIFMELISRNFIVPKIVMGWASLSQVFGSTS